MANVDKSTTSEIHKLIEVLDTFSDLKAMMTAPMIKLFCLVGLYEGRTIQEIAALGDFKKSTASRYIQDMGKRRHDKNPGLGLLVTQEDENDLRRKVVGLSPKGRQLMNAIEQICLRD